MSESSGDPSSHRLPGAALRAGALAFGPLLALAVYAIVGADALTPAGRATLAVAAWMAAWWLTEAVPLAATAMLPLGRCCTTQCGRSRFRRHLTRDGSTLQNSL